MPERTLEDIIEEYLFLGEDDCYLHTDADELWKTDDLIELGVIINKILRERKDG